MSDFEQWQRERDAAEAAAARRADAQKNAEQNADIERDEAYERKHRRRGKRVRTVFGTKHERGTTPIWRLTAGSWAQLLLSVVWVAVIGLGSGVFSGPQSDGKGWLSLGVLVVGVVLGPVTWHLIGPRAREVMRTGVRFAPVVLGLVLVGTVLWRKAHPADVAATAAAVTTTPTAPTTPTTPQPTPTPPPMTTPTTPTTRPPPQPLTRDSPAPAFQAALAADGDAAWQALSLVGEAHAHAHRDLRAARSVPGDEGRLARALARVDELATLAAPLQAFSSAHSDELVARATKDPQLQFALRFTAPDASSVQALAGAAVQHTPEDDVTPLDSLTALLARGAPLPEHPRRTPAHVAWWRARSASRKNDVDAACRTLGSLTLQGPDRERSVAIGALQDLGPRCGAAGPVILKGLLARAVASMKTPLSTQDEAHFAWAFRAVGHTGIPNAGALLRFLRDVEGHGGLRGQTNPGAVLDEMFERHVLATLGVSRLVWGHPTALAGVERPDATLGPCRPAQVGLKTAAEVARLGERPCVLALRGPGLARTPLGLADLKASAKPGTRTPRR